MSAVIAAGRRAGSAQGLALLLAGLLVLSGWNTPAVAETCVAGGIGGTGSSVDHGGIGGTGNPLGHGGIGGTGAPAPNLAGRVVFAKGEVRAAAADAPARPLAKGDVVCERDLLATGDGAYAQIAMTDGGTLILREQSALKIAAYVYNGGADDSEHSTFELVRGGFRAITGAIGHARKEAYAIRTPGATVEIRGTDHETFYLPPPLPGQPAAAAPGTYNHVLAGGTTLKSDAGKVLINPGQTGFAPLAGTPSLLPAPPSFLADPLPRLAAKPGASPAGDKSANGKGAGPAKAGEGEGAKGDAPQTPLPAAAAEPQATPDAGSVPAETQAIVLTNGVGLNNSSSGEPPLDSLVEVPVGTAYVGVHLTGGAAAHGSLVSDGNASSVMLDAEGKPYLVFDGASGFNYHAAGSPPLVDFGAANVDGVDVNWGIYAGGITYDADGNGTAVDFHHFAFAPGGATPPDVIANLSGTANFANIVGFTKPTSEQNALGGAVTAASVDVQFGAAPAVVGYNIGVADAHARQWNGSFAGSVPLAAFANGGVPLAVTCAGAGCGSGGGNGAAGGQIIGLNAKGLISGYSLGTTTGQSVAGIVVLSRP